MSHVLLTFISRLLDLCSDGNISRHLSHLLLIPSAFTARFFPGGVTSGGSRQGCGHSAQLLLWIHVPHGQMWLCLTHLAAEVTRCHPAALGSFTCYCFAPPFLTAPAQQFCVLPSRAWLSFSKAATFLLTQRHHPLKCSRTDVQCVLLFRKSMSCPDVAK